jgi:predicted nuclease of restriction endonuclease-like (RecB) superfamily
MAIKDKIVSSAFYNNIRNIIIEARKKAYRTINFVQVQAYWDIGRLIVEEEQKGEKRAEYGKYLLKGLSEKLTEEFGEGYTERKLRYMRAFYLNFPIRHAARSESIEERRKALHPELSWTHYRVLLKVKSPEEREFYMNECIENQWPTRYLERQINSLLFQRLLVSRDKKELLKAVKKESQELEPKHIIKDPYILDFLGLKENTKFFESDWKRHLWISFKNFFLNSAKDSHLWQDRNG